MKRIFSFHPRALLSALLFALLCLWTGGAAQASLAEVNGEGLRYLCEGRHYLIKRYEPPQDYADTPERGEFTIEDWSQSGYDVTFDYMPDEYDTYIIYNNAGAYQAIVFVDATRLVTAELLPENKEYEAMYEMDSDGVYRAEIPGRGVWHIDPYIIDGIKLFMRSGADSPRHFTSRAGENGVPREFVLKRTPLERPNQTRASFPNRYMLQNEDNEDEWVAFTYDPSSRIFAMYNSSSETEPYAYRRFSPNFRELENQQMRSSYNFEAPTGTYTVNMQGIYSGNYTNIHKYITDGLQIFLSLLR